MTKIIEHLQIEVAKTAPYIDKQENDANRPSRLK